MKKSPSAAPSTVDGVHKSEEKEKVPKIAEVPEHILEILSTKGDINDNANDASLSHAVSGARKITRKVRN